MDVIELSGSPGRMGESFGEQCREKIHELYELRATNAIRDALRFGGRTVNESDLLEVAFGCHKITEKFDPIGTEEQWGISRGADLPMSKITALGGLTDFRDVLSWGGPLETDGGCTAVVVSSEKSSDGEVRLAQTWDLASNNMPYVVYVHRKPDVGAETWAITTVGCLSLVGVNEYGLAVGTTNLRTVDSRLGVPYLNVIHRALREQNTFAAIEVVTQAPRAGGHTYALADHRSAVVVECTAERHAIREPIDGFIVQTNHCQSSVNREVEAEAAQPSSKNRFERMTILLKESPNVSEENLRNFLSDTEGEDLAISRHDFDGISTNAAIVIAPAMRSISVVHGPPDENPWRSMV